MVIIFISTDSAHFHQFNALLKKKQKNPEIIHNFKKNKKNNKDSAVTQKFNSTVCIRGVGVMDTEQYKKYMLYNNGGQILMPIRKGTKIETEAP